MTAAAGYTLAGLAFAGCTYALIGRQRIAYLRSAARYHLTRRRYARRMLGPLPVWDQDVPYSRREWRAFLEAWDAPAARPERTRT